MISLIDYMICLSPFLDVIRMSISTVSLLALLDSGIFCQYNALLCLMILVALSLELTDSKQIFCILQTLFTSFSCNSMPCMAVQPCME